MSERDNKADSREEFGMTAEMEDILERLRSLSLSPPPVSSLSLSSKVTPSNQVTRLDDGFPVIAPLDTLDEVQLNFR